MIKDLVRTHGKRKVTESLESYAAKKVREKQQEEHRFRRIQSDSRGAAPNSFKQLVSNVKSKSTEIRKIGMEIECKEAKNELLVLGDEYCFQVFLRYPPTGSEAPYIECKFYRGRILLSTEAGIAIPGHEPKLRIKEKYFLEPMGQGWGWLNEKGDVAFPSADLADKLLRTFLDLT